MGQARPLIAGGRKLSRGAEGSVEAASALCVAMEAAGSVCPDTCALPKSHQFCVQFPTA